MPDNQKEPVKNSVDTPSKSLKSKRWPKRLLIALLILLLAGLAFSGGWFWQQTKINKLQKEKNAAEEKAAKNDSSQPVEKRLEVTRVQVAGPADRSFTVEFPVDWLSDTCGEQLLFIANTEARLGKCNTEYFGMMSFGWSTGDTREPASTYSSSPDYADFTNEPVTINGVPGDRLSYRFVGESIVGYPATGSSFITYRLFDGTNTYGFTYDRNSGETNYSSEFDAIVQSLDTTP